MATLTLDRAELARLLEADPGGRLTLDGLSENRLVVRVKAARLLPAIALTVEIVECRDGLLRLRLGPDSVLRMASGMLEERGLSRKDNGLWEVDSGALFSRWLAGARLTAVRVNEHGLQVDLAIVGSSARPLD